MPAVCKPGPKIFGPRKGLKKPINERVRKIKRGSRDWAAQGQVGFDVPTQIVGATADGRVVVYVDPNLGAPGLANAQAVLAWAPQIVRWHDEVFGFSASPVNLIIGGQGMTGDGTGGAYHYGCDFTSGADLYCDGCAGNDAVVAGLFSAELSECYMGDSRALNSADPWGCGWSTGEGLSRVCANETCALVGTPGALDALGYGAAPSWNTAHDWIGTTETTDGDYDSIGASMVAIDWLRSQRYPLWQIAQAPCDTLDQCYHSLTGRSGLYAILVQAVQQLPGGVTSDYPFTGGPAPGGAVPGGSSPPPPPPPGPPLPPPPPGVSQLAAYGVLGSTGAGLPITLTGTVTPPAVPAERASDWWGALVAVAQLVTDIRAGAWGSIPVDLAAIATAVGVPLGAAEAAEIRAALPRFDGQPPATTAADRKKQQG
jgi:hypothetical protein